MEQLKTKIVEASSAVEEEKTKTIKLLNLIFPADIAQKLWKGKRNNLLGHGKRNKLLNLIFPADIAQKLRKGKRNYLLE